MKVIVLGAGIIGVSTAWYLLDQGHDVTVVDRQPDAAPGDQLRQRRADLGELLRALGERGGAVQGAEVAAARRLAAAVPSRLDPQQWRWGLAFLAQCTDAAPSSATCSSWWRSAATATSR